MLVNLTEDLPKHCVVAVSGGADSVFALKWLSSLQHHRVMGVAHFNHNSGDFSEYSADFVNCLAMDLGVEFYYSKCPTPIEDIPKVHSKEAFWSNARHDFFSRITTEASVEVVTAHTLDDCVEHYIMSTMIRGKMDVIEYRRGHILRPMRLTKKVKIKKFLSENKISHLEDPYNEKSLRGKIRKHLLPELTKISPGLYRLVSDLVKGTRKIRTSRVRKGP